MFFFSYKNASLFRGSSLLPPIQRADDEGEFNYWSNLTQSTLHAT